MADYDTLVVGGGFYGCMVAHHLAGPGCRVLLVEKQPDLLQRASLLDHARLEPLRCLPRLPAGASRCQAAHARFLDEFRSTIDTSSTSYCAVGRASNKYGIAELHQACQQAGVNLEPAGEGVRRLFDSDHVEAVFRIEQALFDASRLRAILVERLRRRQVELALETTGEQVRALLDGSLLVTLRQGETTRQVRAGSVFNCSYSQLNELMHRSGLPTLALEHQLTELVLVETPAAFRRMSLSVLGGPFVSLSPFPSTPWHTLSQSRYLPHPVWSDLGPDGPSPHEALDNVNRESGFERMRREASRYVPALAGLAYQRSLWEVRSSPPPDGTGRATVFRSHCGVRHLHCALGTSFEGIYEVLEQVDRLATRRPLLAA